MIFKRSNQYRYNSTSEASRNTNGTFSGKTFIIRRCSCWKNYSYFWYVLHHSRDEYKEIIEREGAKNSSSISKKTSFVLAGDNMGPSKKEKCEKLGIPLISEEEFLEMIGGK